jgi:CubicO group peptidase (beta-lactamase class C family)
MCTCPDLEGTSGATARRLSQSWGALPAGMTAAPPAGRLTRGSRRAYCGTNPVALMMRAQVAV